MKNLQKKLRDKYIKLLIPAIILFILEFFVSKGEDNYFSYPGKWFNLGLLLLVFSTGYIIPIWIRITQYRKYRKQKNLATSVNFEQFEHTSALLSLSGIYVAPLAFLFHFPDISKYAIALAAIYSLYYFYPSDKKLEMDRRIFGLKK